MVELQCAICGKVMTWEYYFCSKCLKKHEAELSSDWVMGMVEYEKKRRQVEKATRKFMKEHGLKEVMKFDKMGEMSLGDYLQSPGSAGGIPIFSYMAELYEPDLDTQRDARLSISQWIKAGGLPPSEKNALIAEIKGGSIEDKIKDIETAEGKAISPEAYRQRLKKARQKLTVEFSDLSKLYQEPLGTYRKRAKTQR